MQPRQSLHAAAGVAVRVATPLSASTPAFTTLRRGEQRGGYKEGD